MAESIRETLEGIIARFDSGELPGYCYSTLIRAPNVPASNWDQITRTKLFMAGTCDARSRKLWHQIGREVKKGARPIRVKIPMSKGRKGNRLDRRLVIRRKVYRAEDTYGAPLPYEPVPVPGFPLLEKAIEWGISVRVIPGDFMSLGTYKRKSGEILLSTLCMKVFFHELAHAAMERLGYSKAYCRNIQEIIAELVACVLYQMVVKEPDEKLGTSYIHVFFHSVPLGRDMVQICRDFAGEAEAIVTLILTTSPKGVPQ